MADREWLKFCMTSTLLKISMWKLPYVRYKNVAKEKSAGVALIELIDFLSFALEIKGQPWSISLIVHSLNEQISTVSRDFNLAEVGVT